MLQCFRCWHFQFLSPQGRGAVALVVFPEYRPGGALGVVGEEKPVAIPARQVNGGVAPGLGGLRRGCLAGFQIGVVGRGQAVVPQPLLAALVHAVQGWQVFAVLNGVPGTLENLFHRVVAERLQPQFLDLLQLFCIRVGGVVLVVVIQAEQGEYLVDRLDQFCRGSGPGRFSLPRRYR